ncbi:MAG: hypothetical protein LBG50_02105 [Clostridiales Family XIII bacterium]|jgi:uncharacterized membrane protein YhaH (DUF805 family)|nr:hypothetical protein [Clostridiales Family XIII bacterium]
MMSMYLVVAVHIFTQGGVMAAVEPFTPKYYAALFCMQTAMCGVNCFALISGYTNVCGTYRYSRIAELWISVSFYSFLSIAVFSLLRGHDYNNFVLDTIFNSSWDGAVTKDLIKECASPIFKEQYWYVTAYFAMFFIIPYMNSFCRSLSKAAAIRLVIIIIVILSVLPSIYNVDLFRLRAGYSASWLAMLYIIGALIRLHETGKPACGRFVWIALFLLSTLLNCAIYIHDALGGVPVAAPYLSPFTIAQALCLLMAFKGLRFRRRLVIKAISLFAPASFAVYILNATKLFYRYGMKELFLPLAKMQAWQIVLFAALSAAAFFIAASLIEIARLRLFRALGVNRGVRFAIDKLIVENIGNIANIRNARKPKGSAAEQVD